MLTQGFHFHYNNYSSIAQVLVRVAMVVVRVFKFHISEPAALSVLLFLLDNYSRAGDNDNGDGHKT